jgi:amino acid transporter
MDEITARAIRYVVDNPPPAARERAPTPWDKIRGVLRKFLGDGLLAYITYSILFVANFNSGTNSMQTGRMILLCIAAAEPGTPDVNRDAVRLIGVVVLTAICLLQFFSPAIGRALNKGFAVVKILFLFALFFVGVAANAHSMTTPDGVVVDRAPDWTTWHETGSKLYFAKALLAVLFAFEGWENATFVSRTPGRDYTQQPAGRLIPLGSCRQVTGEIPKRRQHVLRSGFVSAVATVGILYVLVVAMFVSGIPARSSQACIELTACRSSSQQRGRLSRRARPT